MCAVFQILFLEKINFFFPRKKTFQIETIVNPFKSGMRTIKNMPDSLVGGKQPFYQSIGKKARADHFVFLFLGMAKLLLGKGPNKENAFLDVTPIHLEVNNSFFSFLKIFSQNPVFFFYN